MRGLACQQQLRSPQDIKFSRRQALLLQTATGLSLFASQGARAEDKKTIEIYNDASSSYDSLDGGIAASALGFNDMRAKLLAQARGKTLETAVGTGLNLPYYIFGSSSVTELVGVDISTGMISEAKKRAEGLKPSGSITLLEADVTSLPLDNDSFDSVVDSFSLCVFSQPISALKEMRRVVKPGGQVLLLEHTRSDNPLLSGYQQITAEAVRRTSRGCDWNQDVPALLQAAGLEIVRMERALGGTIISIEATKAS